MNRKIVFSSDEPRKTSCFKEDFDNDPVFSDSIIEVQFSDVEERELEIERATADYIVSMMGAEGVADAIDFGVTEDMLTEIIDAFEMILYEFGLLAYRPFIDIDAQGNDIIIPSRYSSIE